MTNYKYQLSIILPIRNEEAYIVQTLSQIVSQSLNDQSYEIIVVDGESTDKTKSLVESFIKQNPNLAITFLSNPKRLSSAARNIGAKASQAEYVLIIDGHVFLADTHILQSYIDSAKQHDAKVLGRPQPLNPPDTDAFQKSVALARTSKLAHSQESFIYSDFSGFVSPLSVAVMYHQSVFEHIGYFDESFDAAEDLEFNYRLEKANYQCYFSNKLEIKYYPRTSVTALFKQLTRYGLGRARFFKKHPERFTWENIAPALLFLLIAITPIMLVASSATKYLWVIGGLSYAALLLIESLRLMRTKVDFKTSSITLASIIATIHLGLGWGFLKGTWLTLFSFNNKRKLTKHEEV